MRHLEKALNTYMSKYGKTGHINITNCEDIKGIAPIVSFTHQSDPVGEVGVNGVQCVDIIKYSLELLKSLNEVFPCVENENSIDGLELALEWQDKRTKDRESRNVEGFNKA